MLKGRKTKSNITGLTIIHHLWLPCAPLSNIKLLR